jgi:hypothetical protein
MNFLEMIGADSAFLMTVLKWTLIILFLIVQAIFCAVLAHEKGYSVFCGFTIGLFMPVLGLIFEAGRPLSPDKEDDRQRQHARELARVLRRDIFDEDRLNNPQPIKRRITVPRD